MMESCKDNNLTSRRRMVLLDEVVGFPNLFTDALTAANSQLYSQHCHLEPNSTTHRLLSTIAQPGSSSSRNHPRSTSTIDKPQSSLVPALAPTAMCSALYGSTSQAWDMGAPCSPFCVDEFADHHLQTRDSILSILSCDFLPISENFGCFAMRLRK